ncbi:MAG: hypothetical protein V4760_18455 [Bdellovibrionota bacterium]
MKLLALLFMLTFAPSAFAVDIADMPAELSCVAPAATMPDVRTLELTKLDTETPESTLRMGFQEGAIRGDVYDFSFSDECEGWYSFKFDVADLLALKSGAVETIQGEFEYDDLGEFFENPTDENQHDLTVVTCRLK